MVFLIEYSFFHLNLSEHASDGKNGISDFPHFMQCSIRSHTWMQLHRTNKGSMVSELTFEDHTQTAIYIILMECKHIEHSNTQLLTLSINNHSLNQHSNSQSSHSSASLQSVLSHQLLFSPFPPFLRHFLFCSLMWNLSLIVRIALLVWIN